MRGDMPRDRSERRQDDFLYVTQPTCNILLALGAWPCFEDRSVNWRAQDLLLIAISYILLSCDIVPGVIHWLMQETSRARLQLIPLLLYDLMSVSQYGIFILRRERLRQCLRHVEEDWRDVPDAGNGRRVMLRSARTGKRLVTVCGVFMYSSMVAFRTILPLSQGRIVTDQNVTVRALPCPGYFFALDVQASPVYDMVFAVQCLTGFVMVSVVTAACGLTAIFVLHACGQLKILIDLMRDLVAERRYTGHEVDQKLAGIVRHQMKIRGFLRLVQSTLQEIYLLEIMVNTITICLLLYFFIVDWGSSNVGILSTYLICIINVVLHMFLFCYTGERLSIQAEKVAVASCELEWYRLPDRKARSVVLLMIMSNAPTKISAGNIFDLSLKTFGDVVKTAGAYFNMLRSVIE